MIENRTTASSRPPGPCRFSMVFRNCALISFWKIISLKLAAAEAERWGQSIIMILWTIQTERAWSEFQKRGILKTSRKNIIEENWILPYQWMVDQMKIRLGSPPESWYFPLWAWYQWEGEKRRKPDLRAGGHLGKGEKGIRIEFECCEDAALLSDFDLWHYVLNYWYLPETEHEAETFEAELAAQGLSFFKQKPIPNDRYHRRIVESWNRIFDLNWYEHDLAEPFRRKSLQATVWELSLDQVRIYKHFTSREMAKPQQTSGADGV